MKLLITISIFTQGIIGTSGFVSMQKDSQHHYALIDGRRGATNIDSLSNMVPSPETQDIVGPSDLSMEQENSISSFDSNSPVLDGELAGDYGFDPLRLAKDKESLWAYREAEVKHARLAMLAVVGWPTSELLDGKIAAMFGAESVLDAGDRAPSLFNGGLEKISPEWWGFCLGMTASINLYSAARAEEGLPGYIPGDLGFDPLGLYPESSEGKRDFQTMEINHGRAAMIGVAGLSLMEAQTKIGVIDEMPIFFAPATKAIEDLVV
mmetsp:Transcript_28571/g.43926  ORF Transcript_28571/g.43926 Transcript_28571/m.43926 type:complete len:265 (+) Transcript_28571:121-915(+)